MGHIGRHRPLAGQTPSQMQTEREVEVSSPAALGPAWKLSVLKGHLLMEKVLWPSFLTWNRNLVETGGENDSFRKVQTEEEQRCYLRYFQARIFQVVLNPTLVLGAGDWSPCLCFCGLCWDTAQGSGLWARVRMRCLVGDKADQDKCVEDQARLHVLMSGWNSTWQDLSGPQQVLKNQPTTHWWVPGPFSPGGLIQCIKFKTFNVSNQQTWQIYQNIY